TPPCAPRRLLACPTRRPSDLLATVSVILGDWKRMPQFRNDPGLLEEITEMQTQLQRCKTIVSGILLSAGEARGESAVHTTVRSRSEEHTSELQSRENLVCRLL